MKKILPKTTLTLSALAFVLTLTLILNFGIASAQTAEDEKIVSEPSVSVASVNSMGVKAEGKNVKWESQKDDSVQIDEKDLDLQEGANLAAKAIAEYFDVDVSDATFLLSKAGSFLWDKPLRAVQCETTDFSYFISMNSVTGEIYDMVRFPNTLTAYSGIEDEAYSDKGSFIDIEFQIEATEDEKAFRAQQLADPAYLAAAESFVKEKFSDKIAPSAADNAISTASDITISKAKNIYQGSAGGKIGISTVLTAVDLSDGSGYMISMGAKTKTIIGFTYYPNGVVEYLKNEYKSTPDKLSVYDALDD